MPNLEPKYQIDQQVCYANTPYAHSSIYEIIIRRKHIYYRLHGKQGLCREDTLYPTLEAIEQASNLCASPKTAD